MADLLDRVMREIDARQRELEPLVDEHAQLRAALNALEGHDGTSAARARTPRASASPQTTPSRQARRASRGARAEQVRAAVRAKPGIGVSELAQHIGVSRPYLYTLLARLEQEGGSVIKRGTGWHPSQPS